MKKLSVLIVCSLLLFNCKSKKPVKTTESTAAAKKSELNIAQKRWPGTTESDLAEGKTISETKCVKCHGQKQIVTRSEENWLKVIDRMAPKAKLTDAEKDKLTKYILSYREANVTTD